MIVLFLAFVAFVAMITFAAIMNGFTLSILWGWFIVPVFGLHDLTIVQAIGISFIIGFFTAKLNATEDPEEEDRLKVLFVAIATRFSYCLGMLAIGFVIHLFM